MTGEPSHPVAARQRQRVGDVMGKPPRPAKLLIIRRIHQDVEEDWSCSIMAIKGGDPIVE